MASNVVMPAAFAMDSSNDGNTKTPIKHAIIIVGENRTFDHLFATYMAPKGTVLNLLSQGIVNSDGSPGPSFKLAQQNSALDLYSFSQHPPGKSPYKTLTPPLTGGLPTSPSDGTEPPFATKAYAAAADYGLADGDTVLLTTGATGLPANSVDTRIPNVAKLPNGPFELTGLYDAYMESPVHRFFQMWQQMDCSVAYATVGNPAGCLNDLFPWVETSVGAGSNGKPQPAGFNDQTTHEGSTAMGFYNVQKGDMPYFKSLADQYALSDNYHQPTMGGTGADSYPLGFADYLYYTDGKGKAATPPADQIENPDPQPGTNNYYTQDGYSGGSYVACADLKQPGVAPIVTYLRHLPYKAKANCEPGHYYLLNNYNPGYYGDGTVDTKDVFTIPPVTVRSIGDALIDAKISWKYYGEGWNQYVKNPDDLTNVYCNICNPFQYETAIMTDKKVREEHLKDTLDLYQDIANGTLPAVTYVKPGGLNDGHPASSKFNIFESFTKKIVEAVQANPTLWASTAIFITVDEGGGYYDAGYTQILDFFGDGTRIPMIVVSPYSKGVGMVHDYGDHASWVKFIEANWGLSPLTKRSRDNLPNPIVYPEFPYVPVNGPALTDLMTMFKF
jgi:phospholipase C